MPATTKTILEILGDEVRERRTQRHLSQEDLADEAGVHTNVIGRLERGETNSQVLTLFGVATGLQAPLAELIAAVEKAAMNATPTPAPAPPETQGAFKVPGA